MTFIAGLGGALSANALGSALGGSILGGVASAVTGGLNALGNKINYKQAYKYQRKIMDYQNTLNIANWNMQNEYNLPSNQMQRFKDAGLNPNLIYSQNNASSSLPSISPGTSPKQESIFDQAQSLNLLTMAEDLRGKRLQNDLTQQDIYNRAQERKESEERIKNLRQTILESSARVRNLEIDLQKKGVDIRNAEIDGKIKETILKTNEINLEWLPKEKQIHYYQQLQIFLNLYQEYRCKVAQELLTRTNVDVAKKTIQKMDAEILTMASQRKLNDSIINLNGKKADDIQQNMDWKSYSEFTKRIGSYGQYGGLAAAFTSHFLGAVAGKDPTPTMLFGPDDESHYERSYSHPSSEDIPPFPEGYSRQTGKIHPLPLKY